ncbi:MAG: retropepsin-like aspartic protease [Candidatus Aminicenantales bacterium]
MRRPRPKRVQIPRLPLLAGAAVILALCGVLYFSLLRPPEPDEAGDVESLNATASSPTPLKADLTSLIVGQAIVFDISDHEVSRWGVTVFDDGWIALPAAALLGGNSTFFQSGDSGEIRLERGIWSAGDPVAMWQVETGSGLNTPDLAAWKPRETLSWRPLGPSTSIIPVDINTRERRGSFAAFPLPEEMRVPGILIQDGRLVGWTFGNGLDRGFIWTDAVDGGLEPRIGANQLFAALSASREADFSRALAIKGMAPELERLEIFARGFTRPQILAAEDLPSPLRMGNAITEMHALAAALTREGRADEVLRVLSPQVLLESSKPLLVQDAVLAMVKSKDHYRGIQYLETIKRDYTAARGQSLGGLDSFHAQLYKDWLRKIITEGGYFNAMSAFDMARKAFPDDPEIRLLGVEAAMAEEDYGRAQELLQARDYPPLLKNRVSQLENQVKAKQEESEALTIRFNPGEEHIPVYADLNGRYRQKFIFDTGAEMCTIPSSALEYLGIEIDDRTTVKLVSGVGGLGVAYEITLESIAMNGWNVENVQALIVDVLAYPDCGLMGLNFLNHFRYEIDKQKGILRLRRR